MRARRIRYDDVAPVGTAEPGRLLDFLPVPFGVRKPDQFNAASGDVVVVASIHKVRLDGDDFVGRLDPDQQIVAKP